MYVRRFDKAPDQIIKNGKAAFGTYSGVSPKLDICGMHAPYAGVPLPTFISRLRIKSRLNYIFSLDDYLGFIDFYDFKVFGMSQFILWSKKTGTKYVYHTVMKNPRRYIANETSKGRSACYKKGRNIKIAWGRNHKHNALTFKLKGDATKPSIEGYCHSTIQDPFHTDAMFVNPSPASSRCSATWINTLSVKGKINFYNKSEYTSEGLSAMIMNRTYYKLRSSTTFALGLGTVKNKKVVFNIKTSTMDAANNDDYNENILVIDGEQTALPPVYITHALGIEKNWVIQDTEGMIDLTFTPLSVDQRTLNVIALRKVSNSIYGTFEGTLLTKDGDKLSFKGLPGIINKSNIRL